jgi:ABC-type glycerol-3-phosphate transport system permease component
MKIDASSRITPAQRALTHVVLLVLAAVAMVPFFAMVSTSLKSDAQVYESAAPSLAAMFTPWRWRWRNYQAAPTSAFCLHLGNTLFLLRATVLGG